MATTKKPSLNRKVLSLASVRRKKSIIKVNSEKIMSEYMNGIDQCDVLITEHRSGKLLNEEAVIANKTLDTRAKLVNGMTGQVHADVKERKLNATLARAEKDEPGFNERTFEVGKAHRTGNFKRLRKLARTPAA